MNNYNMSNLLRISGLATGLDTDSIVKQLIRAASIPLDRLEQQKQWYQWQQEDLRDINSQLLSLRDNNVFALTLQGTFLAKTVSSNSAIATATATSSAVNGTYTINVAQLAQPAYRTSGQLSITDPNAALNQTGTIVLNNVSIAVTSTDSLNSIIAKINNAGAGVTASYDTNLKTIFLVSTTTGSSAKIDFSGSDSNGWNILNNTLMINVGTTVGTDSYVAYGKNSQFTLNNGTTVYSESTNNFTLLGLNITLTGTGTTTLTVSTDVDKIYNSIKNFVDTYNDVITKINTKLTEKRYYDYPPLTSEQKQAMKDSDITLWEQKARSGDLANDETLMRIYYSMRNVVSSTVSGVGSLSSIGITTGQWYEGGKLYIDETKLRDAIANNLDEVMKIFSGVYQTDSNGNTTLVTPGIAQNLYDTLNSGIDAITQKAGSTTQLYDSSFIGNRIREIDDRIVQMQEYLNNLEQRYYAQFTQLEMYVSQMNSQSAWLSQQIGVMGK